MTHTLRIAYPETVTDRPAPIVWHGAGTLADAIATAKVKPPFAAAVNMHFVPKKNHASHLLQTGDKIELIVPVTGG